MTTIAQSSATFIAITAGFFTTKIISLSTEKSRLERQKNETESKLRTLSDKQSRLDGKREEILMRHAIERVDNLVKEINSNPLDYSLSKLEDLITAFEKNYEFSPTERQVRILTDRKDVILTKWRERKEQELDTNRSPERKKINWLLTSKSDSARTTEAVHDTYEQSMFTNIDNELNETRYQISNLQDDQKRTEDELTDIVYPKHSRFGFISFIIFAGLGVIIPMAYRSWGTYLIGLSDTYPIILQYLPTSNDIVIMLFAIGLAINFIYIFLEVRPSLVRLTGHKPTQSLSSW